MRDFDGFNLRGGVLGSSWLSLGKGYCLVEDVEGGGTLVITTGSGGCDNAAGTLKVGAGDNNSVEGLGGKGLIQDS